MAQNKFVEVSKFCLRVRDQKSTNFVEHTYFSISMKKKLDKNLLRSQDKRCHILTDVSVGRICITRNHVGEFKFKRDYVNKTRMVTVGKKFISYDFCT
jgi:hypothetical protein